MRNKEEEVLKLIETTNDSSALEDIIMSMTKRQLKRFERSLKKVDSIYNYYLSRSKHESTLMVFVTEQKRISDKINYRVNIMNCDNSYDENIFIGKPVPLEIGMTIYNNNNFINIKGSGKTFSMCTEDDWNDFIKISNSFIKTRRKDFSLFGSSNHEGKTEDDDLEYINLDD